MAEKETIIKLEHLSKTFDGKKVLDDISLDIKKGEFVTLLGPSGCGKTTTLRLIAGFLKPDEGEILMDGKDISDIPPYQRPLNTVFQRYALFPHLDVYDNVAFGLKLKHLDQKEINRRVSKALRLVSMTDYEDRDVNSLSGGQQQRVAIARALVNKPHLLLLDEPLAALDLKMRKDMQIELKEMHQQLGITFIYVTHDQEEALTLSDTVVVMKDGRIQQIGTPMDVYNEPKNDFVADFIGESNILDGVMIEDRKVEFIGHEFECVDEGFEPNEPVSVVVRPEDIYMMNNIAAGQFTGVVKSCTFKGVHYEMFVDSDSGFELMIQDYNAFEVGSTVGLLVKPQDIQVMHKRCVINEFEAEIVDENHVRMLDGVFECGKTDMEPGTKVIASVPFNKIDMMDNLDDGTVCGHIDLIIYRGDHYSIDIITDDGYLVVANTKDVWDKNDLVGIRINPEDIMLTKPDGDGD